MLIVNLVTKKSINNLKAPEIIAKKTNIAVIIKMISLSVCNPNSDTKSPKIGKLNIELGDNKAARKGITRLIFTTSREEENNIIKNKIDSCNFLFFEKKLNKSNNL